MSLHLRPITLRAANAFVALHHRHHKPSRGCRFCLSAWKGGQLVGVAIASRPVARKLDDGQTVEVVRLCTDGTENACSFLLGAVRRAARELGYTRAITYTLPADCAGRPAAGSGRARLAVAIALPLVPGPKLRWSAE